MMREAVEERAGEPFRADDRSPFIEWQVRSDDGRAAFIALAEHLEEQFRTDSRERHVAQFVDDQQFDLLRCFCSARRRCSSRDGVIASRKLSRAKLIGAIAELAPEVIAMEACASAHYWGRQFLAAGHRIRLINPRFVKPFVKGSKNDAVDAEAFTLSQLTTVWRLQ
jgi:hypothetical protein